MSIGHSTALSAGTSTVHLSFDFEVFPTVEMKIAYTKLVVTT